MNKEEENFIDKIDKIIYKKIDFSGSYSRPISVFNHQDFYYNIHDHLSLKNKIITRYCGYVHKWFPANPNKKETVERGNELYIDKITKREQYSGDFHPESAIANLIVYQNYDPTKRIYNIERLIRINKNIVVLGNRGVGKTTFFNYWLNNRTKYLEEFENKIWFRVDASKIYGMLINLKNYRESYGSDIKLDLELYHKIHTLYVIIKYGDERMTSPALFGTLNNLWKVAKEDKDIYHVLTKAKQSIENYLNIPDGKDTERFLSWAIKKDNIKPIEKTYDISVQYWLKNNHKIIFIVDGVDNISKNDLYKEFYDQICRDVGGLFLNDFREDYSSYFSNIIIVIRPETFVDIEYEFRSDHMNNNEYLYEKCIIAPTCAFEILSHKSSVTINPKSSSINKEKENKISSLLYSSSLFEDINNCKSFFNNELIYFNQFSNEYMDKIMSAIKLKYSQVSKFYEKNKEKYCCIYKESDFNDISNIIEILFNDNIRACVDNFIENYRTIKFAEQKNIPGAGNENRYPQYLLLNGRLFLNSSKNKKRIRGESYPNIFWWDLSCTENKETSWFGLSITRILQILSQREYVEFNTLNKILIGIFNYPENLISNQIDRLIKYGMIEFRNNHEERDRKCLSITKKGKFILEFSFIYTDWIYFYALDTYIDDNFCHDKDSRYIKIHRDLKYNFIDLFNIAYITTTLTFCRHISTQNKIDKENIRKNWEKFHAYKNRNGFFKDIDHALLVFDIPKHFIYLVRRAIRSLLVGLVRSDKKTKEKNVENLIQDLTGIYHKELL